VFLGFVLTTLSAFHHGGSKPKLLSEVVPGVSELFSRRVVSAQSVSTVSACRRFDCRRFGLSPF